MIPLYGFLQGDTMGLLVFAHEDEKLEEIARKLQRSAKIRVAFNSNIQFLYKDKELDLNLKLNQTEIESLDKFIVASKEH